MILFNLNIEKAIINEQVKIKHIGGGINVKNNNRNVMLNNAEGVHFARMKISRIGKSVTSSKNENISIYYNGTSNPQHIGDISNIHMTNSELEEYKKLFMRNLNLIYLNGTNCPDVVKNRYGNNIAKYVDVAFLHDEQLRYYIGNNKGIIANMVRNEFGELFLYDINNTLLLKLDLKFVVEKYNRQYLHLLNDYYLTFLNKINNLIPYDLSPKNRYLEFVNNTH